MYAAGQDARLGTTVRLVPVHTRDKKRTYITPAAADDDALLEVGFKTTHPLLRMPTSCSAPPTLLLVPGFLDGRVWCVRGIVNRAQSWFA